MLRFLRCHLLRPFGFAPVPRLDPAGQIRGWHRTGNEISLGQIASGIAHQVPVIPILHPFGDNLHPQMLAQTQAGVVDRPCSLVAPCAVHKALVDLQFIACLSG